MSILAIFFGAFIGLIVWSRLTHVSYAIYDSRHEVILATKLADPSSGMLSKLIWCVAAASFVWLISFGAACLHFAYAYPPSDFLAWFFGSVATTPFFIALTTFRALRRLKKRNASSTTQ